MNNIVTADLVITTCSPELPVFRLHIESLCQNFDTTFINKIFILVNDKNSTAVIADIKENYLDLFGNIKDKVHIIDGTELLGDVDYYNNPQLFNKGFLAQMVTDCAISKLIETDHYFVVDSKSLFLPGDSPWFLIKKNRIYFPLQPTNFESPYKIWAINKAYFNSPDRYPGFEPTSVRPQIYHAVTMQNMIAKVEKRSGMSWQQFMLNEFLKENKVSGISHFYLYYAYLWYTDEFDKLYEPHTPGIQLDRRIYDVKLRGNEPNQNEFLTVTVARSVFVEQPWAKEEILGLWKTAVPNSTILEEVFEEMVKLNRE